ncbi:hypothetical protein AAMO2058_001154600, partial [Amorphochlora amoebiformis]
VKIGDFVDATGYLRRSPKFSEYKIPEMALLQIQVLIPWSTRNPKHFSLAFIKDRLKGEGENKQEEEKGFGRPKKNFQINKAAEGLVELVGIKRLRTVREGEGEEAKFGIKEHGLCREWASSGHCSRPRCHFRHSASKEEKLNWLKSTRAKKQLRKLLPSTKGDTVAGKDKESHGARARVFCRWLEKTFGEALLRQGGYSKCIVVDPRPVKLRGRLKRRFVKATGGKTWACRQRLTLFNHEFTQDPENKEIIQKSAIFVGMHPDQATEPLVDEALALNKPFAVVPCCVFSYENPDRRLESTGVRVTSYEQFVDYLQEKHPGIKRDFLAFQGKNLVLYKPPESKSSSCVKPAIE